MKTKTLVIILSILAAIGAGVGLYFYLKKKKKKDQQQSKVAESSAPGDVTSDSGNKLLEFIESKTRKNGEKGLPSWSYDGILEDVKGGVSKLEAVAKQFSFLQHGTKVDGIKEEETFDEQTSKAIWEKYYALKKELAQKGLK